MMMTTTSHAFSVFFRSLPVAQHPHRCLLLMLLCFCLCACAAGTPQPPQISLNIETTSQANNGKSFYLVARAVDTQTFLMDSYQDITQIVFSNPPDPSILKAEPILPGNDPQIEIRKPEEKALGIYCMFTEPGDQWKMLLPQPLHDRYILNIEGNRILEAEKIYHKRRGLLQRIFSSDDEEEE